MLDHDRLIAAEAEALARAAEGADPAAAVPGTDWTLADLLDHVGRLTWYWSGRIRTAGGGDFYDTDRPDGVTREDWLRQGTDTMRAQLTRSRTRRRDQDLGGPRSPRPGCGDA